MDEKKKNADCKTQPNPKQRITNPPSKCDPLGSYTGVPETPGEVPTQDADDL